MSLGISQCAKSSKAGRSACPKLGLAFASVMAAMLLATPLMPFGAVGDAAAAEVPTLRYGMDQSVDHLSPFIGVNDNSYVFYGFIYDYLIAIDEDLNPKPNLATSWNVVKDISPIGSVWQYNLTRNAYWHDGEPFTAEDVVFTFEYQTGPNWTTMWAYQPYTILIPQGGVEKLDDYTVRIHFTDFEGNPAVCSFGYSLMMPMIPKHIWRHISPSEAGFSYPNYLPIGTGPFMCTDKTKDEWLRRDRMILYRNPNYHGTVDYGQEVKFERLIIEFYQEPTAMATDLRTGKIDVAAFDAATYDGLLSWLDKNPGMKTKIGTFHGLKCTGYSIEIAVCMQPNKKNNLRLDPAVRQAMAHATDKEFIREHIYKGFAEVGSALLSPLYDYWYWTPTPEEEYYYSIDRANEILDAAGYIWSGNVRVAGPGNPYALQGTPLAFEMVVEEEIFEDRQSALFLEEEWAEVGISITPVIVSSAEWGRLIYGAAYDLTITYWSGDPDPNYLLYVTSSFALGGWSESFYSSSEFDENYTGQLLTVDPALRRPYVMNCQKHLYKDAAMIVTVYSYGCYAWREDRFEGWGDWGLHPGRSLSNFWTANDLWFDLDPVYQDDDDGLSGLATVLVVTAVVAVVVGIVALRLIRKRRGPREEDDVKLS